MRQPLPAALALIVATLPFACATTTPTPPPAPPPPSPSPPLHVAASAALTAESIPPPPPTRRDDFHETLHGVDILDPYRWLEDQKAPETRAWITAQNAYTHSLLDGRPGRDAIVSRLNELFRQDRRGLPLLRGKRYFTSHRGPHDELFTYGYRDTLDGKDVTLLDPQPLSPDQSTDIDEEAISNDGRRIVYSVRKGGEDETELHVLDVDTRAPLPDVLPRALYRDATFDGDGNGFLYSVHGRASGPRLKHHVLGTPVATDTEVFGAGYGPSDGIGTRGSENGRHMLFFVSHGWARNDLLVRDAASGGRIVPVVQGLEGHFNADYAGDHLIVKTDFAAPNGRIVEIDRRHPDPAHWREIVPAGSDVINDWGLVGGRIVVTRLHDVTARLAVYGLDGTNEGEVPLPELGTVTGLSGRWTSDDAFVGFSSFTSPWRALRLSVKAHTATTWWAPDLPFASADYVTEQVFYSSKDGTRVPMFLVHKKGLPRDGARPTVLMGYGGFDVSMEPRFSGWTAWLVEHGFVYAVANIRGGSEYGEEWHRAGKLEKKQNVFDDFIAAAEWLEREHVTSPTALAIEGGSNGGLLVGAAMTQRPELFRAVVCEFPDLDMVGYYRFPNNNPPALLEYGDASKPDQFPFLFAYSPYQHVAPGTAYPAVLFTTGDEDTRVPPLQARKMTARMQAATSSGGPIAILYDEKAGHAGGKSLTKSIEDESLELAFLQWQLAGTP